MEVGRALLIAAAVVLATASAESSDAQDATPKKRTPTVLFMCPHGAAKSVLASAYFERLAKERGLNVTVKSAGTDPDPAVAPAVAAHLARRGYPVPTAPPRKATAEDMAADVVISIGCDLSDVPEPGGRLMRWDEVPPLSEDFARADEAIQKRVIELVEELVRAEQSKKH